MNLSQILSESCMKYGEKPAIVFERRSTSFRQIDDGVRRCSLWLRNMGVQNGDRVALQLPKSMEFIYLHLAVLSLGGVSLPLNSDYSPEEVHYYLSDSGSSLFITDSTRLERSKLLLNSIDRLRMYALDQPGPRGAGPLTVEMQNAGAEDPRTYPARDGDVAMMLYTSGTTGRSKGAMITHRNLASNMVALKKAWEWTDRDILLHVLPLFHVHGLCVALEGGLYAGSTMIMHERFDPSRTWKTIEEKRCSILMGVPTIYHRLLNDWESTKPDLSSMRVFISGSAPLSETLFNRFEQATGFRILERYGMTEAGMILSNPIDPSGRKAKSVGYPLPGVEARIVSEGKDVKPGEVGEVWIKGDNVFKGYWQMPEKTRDAFEDAWFKTGDLGYQDSGDGMRFYLVGRAKELIITGGYNVYPKEVENVLEHHEAVQEAAVIGIADEDYGEKVTAVVVLKKDRDAVASEALLAFCKERLAGYKCPKEIFPVDQLPRNAMGKIQKDALQKRFSKPAG
jgi:malonyl-CoA/methylmalonyl-CoA synthetase